MKSKTIKVKFNVGDRVVKTKDGPYMKQGTIGTVKNIYVDENDIEYWVAFDGFDNEDPICYHDSCCDDLELCRGICNEQDNRS